MTDLSFADYLAVDALSASGAKKILKAPALYKWEHDNPPESTPTFDFGKAAHKLVLGEGDPIEVLDFTAWNATGAKAAKAEAVAAGRVPLLTKDWEKVEAMAASVRANPYARGLLAKGEAEISLMWDDDETGAPCKARPDWLTRIQGALCVVDYKTTKSANPNAFRVDARRYGYDLQCAWYIEAIRVHFGEECDFKFIAQEKEPPYLTSVISLHPKDIEDATATAREAREIYARCRKTGEWPGYGMYTVELPPSYDNALESE